MKTAKEILKEMNSGKIFTAQFIKKDGTPRTITARTGVKKGNKGSGLSFDPIAKNLLPVLDMELAKIFPDINKAKRFINLSTVVWVQISGFKYWVSDLVINESIENIKELNKTILK